MQRRSRARFLAPIALVFVVAGTYLVLHDGLASRPAPTRQVRHDSGLRPRYRRSRVYVVARGDNLTGIATRTGLPVGALEALNPNIDPNSLQTGQRLRLRR